MMLLTHFRAGRPGLVNSDETKANDKWGSVLEQYTVRLIVMFLSNHRIIDHV